MKKYIYIFTYIVLLTSTITALYGTEKETSLFPEEYSYIVNTHQKEYYKNPDKFLTNNTTNSSSNLFIKPSELHEKITFLIDYFLATAEPSSNIANIISQQTLLDSNLLHQTNSTSLFNEIDRTITPFGAAMLTQSLLTIKPIDKLNDQKKIINFLKQNKNPLNELRNYLHAIKQYENDYFNFFTPNENYEKAIHQKYYYNKGSWGDWLGLSYFNSSPLAQNLYQTGGRLRTIGYAGAALGTAYMAAKNIGSVINPRNLLEADKSLGLALLAGLYATNINSQEDKEMMAERILKTNNYPINQETVKTVSQSIPSEEPSNFADLATKRGSFDYTSAAKSFNALSTFDKFQAVGAGMQAADDIIETAGNRIQGGVNRIISIPMNIWDREEINKNLLSYMHTQLINMGHIARQLKNIDDFLLKRPSFSKKLVYGKYIEAIFNKASNDISSDLRYLIELLLTNTFTGSPSWFSNQGRIISAYLLMKNTKIEWLNIFKAIGEIDTYCSCAQLYEEYENSPHKFTFVHYEENKEKPTIVINNLWNILDQDSTSIIKKAELNKENILKLENSAELKPIALALILANTLAIAPANGGMKITPFKTIETLINSSNQKNLVSQAGSILEKISDNKDSSNLKAIIIDNANEKTSSLSSIIEKNTKDSNTIALITT